MKKQAYQKPTIYNSDGTKAQTGTYDIRTDPLTNSTADGILDYINNNLEALNDRTEYVQGELTNYLPLSGGTLTGVVNGVTPPNGDNSKKLATTEFVNAKVSVSTPTGVVQAFAGRTTPQGWLLCDGSAVSRTDYAALYAVIGTTYGAGDGSTTFNLPNLVDKFVEGSATAGTVKSAGLPNITGNFYNDVYGYGQPAVRATTGAFYGGDNGNVTRKATYSEKPATPDNFRCYFDASRSSAVYGKSTTVQPPALTMRYIIKY